MAKKCLRCNVPMTRGKGPKPIVCSKSACRKWWNAQHGTLYGNTLATENNAILRENPDAWDDYFD